VYQVTLRDENGNTSPTVMIPVGEGLVNRDKHEILLMLYDLN